MNKNYSLNIKGELFLLDSPKVMGVINVTPDSFYDGGESLSATNALLQAENMILDGADILDIGGYSSRPEADHISEEEEISRIIPVIDSISDKFPGIIISVDTFRSNVAREGIKAGAHIINDISGGDADSDMYNTVKELQVPYIAMHMAGTPQNMQQNPEYKNVVQDVFKSLSEKSDALRKLGVSDVIMDLGFGFGKTVEHNYKLLQNLSYFDELGHAVLVGISRKSMIYKPLGISPSEALNGTTALHMIALKNGAQILRVHDVKEAKEAIMLYSLTNLE